VHVLLCCGVVLCCAVMCCAVLCCAVLCCVVLCCVVSCGWPIRACMHLQTVMHARLRLDGSEFTLCGTVLSFLPLSFWPRAESNTVEVNRCCQCGGEGSKTEVHTSASMVKEVPNSGSDDPDGGDDDDCYDGDDGADGSGDRAKDRHGDSGADGGGTGPGSAPASPTHPEIHRSDSQCTVAMSPKAIDTVVRRLAAEEASPPHSSSTSTLCLWPDTNTRTLSSCPDQDLLPAHLSAGVAPSSATLGSQDTDTESEAAGASTVKRRRVTGSEAAGLFGAKPA